MSKRNDLQKPCNNELGQHPADAVWDSPSIALGNVRASRPRRRREPTVYEALKELHEVLVLTGELTGAKDRLKWLGESEALGPQLLRMRLNEVRITDVLNAAVEYSKRAPTRSARLVARVKRAFDLALSEGLTENDVFSVPADGLALFEEPARRSEERCLDWREIPKMHEKLESYKHGGTARLGLRVMIFTAAWPADIRFLRWEDIDWEKKTIRSRRKVQWSLPESNSYHNLIMSQPVEEIIRSLKQMEFPSPYVFYAPKTHNRQITENAFGNIISSIGFSPFMKASTLYKSFEGWSCATVNDEKGYRVARVHLGRRESDKSKGFYDRSLYWEERKVMQSAWEQYVLTGDPHDHLEL